MLTGVQRADVRIFGGPLNSPWSEDTALQNFADTLRRELEGRCGSGNSDLSSFFQVQRQLEFKGLIWLMNRLRDVDHFLPE